MSSATMPLRKGSSGPRAFPQAIDITWTADQNTNLVTWDMTDALAVLKDGEHFVGLIGVNPNSNAVQLFGRITVLNGELVAPNALSGTNGSELAQLIGFDATSLDTSWLIAADVAESPAQLIVFT